MQSKKKMIVNTVFLVVIFALTIYGVFHGEDLGAMMEAMRRADVRWLLPGLFCVVFFIWGESIIIWYMMHSFQIPVKKRTCFLFSSVGFFFSCITPSASGGQPMQLYYILFKRFLCLQPCQILVECRIRDIYTAGAQDFRRCLCGK